MKFKLRLFIGLILCLSLSLGAKNGCDIKILLKKDGIVLHKDCKEKSHLKIMIFDSKKNLVNSFSYHTEPDELDLFLSFKQFPPDKYGLIIFHNQIAYRYTYIKEAER